MPPSYPSQRAKVSALKGRETSPSIISLIEVDVVVRESDEILGLEVRRKLRCDACGVLCADPERDHGAGVSEDCLPYEPVELPQVLVGQHEREPILPELGEHRRERWRGEHVELVEVDGEIDSVLFRKIGSGEPREADAGDEKGAEDRRRPIANPSSRNVHGGTLPLSTPICPHVAPPESIR